jgi:hypothetical protein
MRNVIVLGTVLSAILSLPANAALIASFSQNPSLLPTVTATDNGTVTNIVIDDKSTNVSTGTFSGTTLLSFSATSIDAAQTFGGAVIQHYSGNFCFTSSANCGGTNYLSGVFTDAAFGALGGPGLVVNVNNPPDTLTLTSDTIPSNELTSPSAFNITFADVTPLLHINGTTIAGFTADFAGNVSASTQNVFEPGSLAILGTALIGLGMVSLRKRNDGAQA